MRRRDFFKLTGSGVAATLAASQAAQAELTSESETHLDFTGLCLFRDPADKVDVKLLKSAGHVPRLVAPYESVYWDEETPQADYGFKVGGKDYVAWDLRGKTIVASSSGALRPVIAPGYYQEEAPRTDEEWRFLRWLTDLKDLTGRDDPDSGKLAAGTEATVTLQGGDLYCLKPESYFKDVVWEFDLTPPYARSLASHVRFTVSSWAFELNVGGGKHIALTSRGGAATISNLAPPAGLPADEILEFDHFYAVYANPKTPKAKKKVRAFDDAVNEGRGIGPKYCPPGRG